MSEPATTTETTPTSANDLLALVRRNLKAIAEASRAGVRPAEFTANLEALIERIDSACTTTRPAVLDLPNTAPEYVQAIAADLEAARNWLAYDMALLNETFGYQPDDLLIITPSRGAQLTGGRFLGVELREGSVDSPVIAIRRR